VIRSVRQSLFILNPVLRGLEMAKKAATKKGGSKKGSKKAGSKKKSAKK